MIQKEMFEHANPSVFKEHINIKSHVVPANGLAYARLEALKIFAELEEAGLTRPAGMTLTVAAKLLTLHTPEKVREMIFAKAKK